MLNFCFLIPKWAPMLDTAQKAEEYAMTESTVPAILFHKALEEMVAQLFDCDREFELPYKSQIGLNDLLFEASSKRTLRLLYKNQPFTSAELDEQDRMLFEQSGFETHDQYQQVLGEKPLGVFVRSILGLDASAVQSAFSSFLSNGPLTSVQIEFINNLIQQFTRDGQVDPGMLFEQPYNRYHESGVAGVFPLHAEKLLEIVEETNGRAMRG